MNPRIKQLWVTALRSGQYRQGRGILRSTDGAHCCLGVLCDLHAKETGTLWYYDYLGAFKWLPRQVADWAGLSSPDPDILGSTLSRMNDSGATFREIADIIEREL